MSALYEIAPRHRALVEHLRALGMDEQARADTIEAESDLADKVEAYVYVIREHESDAAIIDAEIARLQERKRSKESAVDRLKAALQAGLQAAGETKIERPLFTVALQKNPPAVIVDDESAIPRDYFTSPPAPAPRPDKKAILQATKDGFAVPGVRVEQSTSIRIK